MRKPVRPVDMGCGWPPIVMGAEGASGGEGRVEQQDIERWGEPP